MPQPLRPAARQQNLRFIHALEKGGNVQIAARAAGVGASTLYARRAAHPAFAQRWDAALVAAAARLHRGGPRAAGGTGHRAAGGEPTVVLLKTGRLQLRAARRDSVTREGEQAFLLALSATANVSLAAAAVGVATASISRRRRRNPAFSREMRVAIETGYRRIEMALLEGWMPDSGEDTGWRSNEPPAIPPMTAAQALQLLYLHHKSAEVPVAKMDARLLPGETGELRSARLARLYRAGLAARTEDGIAAAVLGEGGRVPPAPIALPDLAQVTGWSKADPAKGGHGDAALFGGWRVGNLTPEQRAAGRTKGRGRKERE